MYYASFLWTFYFGYRNCLKSGWGWIKWDDINARCENGVVCRAVEIATSNFDCDFTCDLLLLAYVNESVSYANDKNAQAKFGSFQLVEVLHHIRQDDIIAAKIASANSPVVWTFRPSYRQACMQVIKDWMRSYLALPVVPCVASRIIPQQPAYPCSIRLYFVHLYTSISTRRSL